MEQEDQVFSLFHLLKAHELNSRADLTVFTTCCNKTGPPPTPWECGAK